MAQMSSRNVPADQIFADYDRNFRMSSSYSECEPIKDFNPEKQRPNLYEDIKINGLQTPLAVSELDSTEAETLSHTLGRKVKFRVIRGHRRMKSIENIRRDNPHMLETIPALVYKGLSDRDEFKLMADHAHVKGLNEYELFDAIRKLALNTGLSEEQIGHQVGRSRGYVQRRKWIMNLPDVVELNYRRKFERDGDGKAVPCVTFTDSQLTDLYKASNRDREAGRDPSVPDSEFNREWDKLVTSGKTRDPEPKAWTRKEMLDKLNWLSDPIVKIVVQACAGDPVRITDAEEQLTALRTRIAELETEFEAYILRTEAERDQPSEVKDEDVA